MSEEKNNYDYMDERLPDDGGRSLEDIISAVGEQDLAEIPHVPMTPERLAALAAARDVEESLAAAEAKHDAGENLATPTTLVGTAKTGKKKRLYKLVGGIAALFVLVLVGAVIAFNALSVDVGADKNQKEKIVTEDGVVIEVDGDGTSEGEDSVWIATDWEEVEAAKTIYQQLIIPRYIPEGYKLDSLSIEMLETESLICKYTFFNNVDESIEIEIFLQVENLMFMDINQHFRTAPSSKGIIYLHDNEKKATIQIDDGIIVTIWSNCSDEEIVGIIENLSF